MSVQVGQFAPNFCANAVIDQEFKTVCLADYLGKYVILFFYPSDFTFVCPTEIMAFSDRYPEFQALATEILGVSVDSEYAHLAWIQSDRQAGGVGNLNYPLVADLKKEISAAYGVLVADLGVALRGLFIIDKQGILQHASVNNLQVGRSVDETLRSLRAIQHTQAHRGEACPANWEPGKPTLRLPH